MSNALDEFRAQREAADQVQTRLTELAELLRGLRNQVQEARRFWPAMWRRWAVATAFALAAAVAFGSGYAWASRPYDAELANLRSRVELMDFVAERVVRMTPSERRDFDALMKWKTPNR